MANKATANVAIAEVRVHERSFPNRRNGDTWARYYAAPRVYCNVNKGNDDILDDLFSGRRHNRPEAALAPVIRGLVQTYLPEATVRWSQKAGCSCGCSPAFIVSVPDTRPASWRKRTPAHEREFGALKSKDLFVDLEVTA